MKKVHRSRVLCIIYILRNTINKKVYVGRTWRSLGARFHGYKKNQPAIYAAIKKHGKNNFYYEVLTVANTAEMVDYWEGYFMIKFRSLDKKYGYNLRRPERSTEVHSLETRAKMSVAKLGISLTEEHRQHISDATYGEQNAGAKITNVSAREIYLEFMNNTSITISELAEKHNLTNTAINYILHKKSWKRLTADLPDLDMKSRTSGSYYGRSSLTEDIVREIKTKYLTGNYQQKELAELYKVSFITIHEIVRNKTWKHVIAD